MKTIVIGSLNTDLVASGVTQFPKAGEHVYGKRLTIGPGGKSRNIADMIARLSPPRTVAMIGRTVKDPYGLWRLPIDALISAGVNTDYVAKAEYDQVKKLPGIALIPVNTAGQNQIFVLPGISDDFSTEDIDAATDLFETAAKHNGKLVLTLECPLHTAAHAVKLAKKNGLKVLFDPGGIEPNTSVSQIIDAGPFLVKPNEHEAKLMTGIEVKDFASARRAGQNLINRGVVNVLITAGSEGAYLFNSQIQRHIPIANVKGGTEKDETGCGDQTMAALCAALDDGKSVAEAAEVAVLAGTLQFHRHGIQPVTKEELFL